MKESENIMFKTAKDHFENAYIDNNGVIRWVSSDNVPPTDILTEMLVAGFIDQETVVHSMNVDSKEKAAFLEQYVANRAKYGYSDEEKFEMRAAFGDEEVVDMFTGKKVVF